MGRSEKVCRKVFDAKQWNECLLSILVNEDSEVALRGAVVVNNMVRTDKETAEKVLETQVMDVLQALVLKANLDAGSGSPNPTLVKVKSICESTLSEAHKLSLVRTTEEAVEAEEQQEERIEPWLRAPAAPTAVDKDMNSMP